MLKTVLSSSIAILSGVVASHAMALTLTSPAFKDKGFFPYQYGYCRPAANGETKAASDISPPLQWSDVPKGTKSFVLILTDPDIPDSPKFDKKGTLITKGAKRVTGYHWLLVDIPADKTSVPEGAGSKGFVKGGKPTGKTPYGLTGINVYTGAFKSPFAPLINYHHMTKQQLQGTYGGYDGPCAPWNDKAIHHYTFTLYALDVKSLGLPSDGKFKGPQVMQAMQGHILAKSVLSGRFITNLKLMKKNNLTYSSD
ncbi:MAG: YbhB/YbcL family Raf kinase inhibitor-like protein [Coxiellaceae bacterium]|nr:YbhB/YbcL family Raf kinase inhibitor-like protein [Coxiellaceae bacterium]